MEFNERICRNDLTEENLQGIEDYISVMSDVALKGGHDKLYVNELKLNIYKQFGVPEDEQYALRNM